MHCQDVKLKSTWRASRSVRCWAPLARPAGRCPLSSSTLTVSTSSPTSNLKPTEPDCLLSSPTQPSQVMLVWFALSALFHPILVLSSTWRTDPHFSDRLSSCSGWTLSGILLTGDFFWISCDRNVLAGIVSVYPDPPANRLCSSSACVRQCASGSGAATGVPGFCFKKLLPKKCYISSVKFHAKDKC